MVIGLIEGLADGLASLLKFAAGVFSDRSKKRKPMIVGGYMLAAASRALIAVATLWPAVLAARLIDRTGKGIRSAPRDAMIADVTPPKDRGRAFGFHRALDHTGAIIGPLLAMLLLNVVHLELRTMFFVAVIPGVIGGLLLLFALREEPRKETLEGSALPALTGGRLPAAFWRAVVAVGLFSLANSSDAFLLFQAHQAGVSTGMLPLLWAMHHVIKSLFSTRAGALSDRIDRRWLLISGWASYAIIYVLFPFAHSLTVFVVLFVLYAIPFTLSEGAERAWVASFATSAQRGKAFGVYYLVNGLCVLAGTALFGVIYQELSHRAAFYTGAVLAAAAAIVVGLQRREAPDAATL
jgi:sugar phosphate permease